MSRLEEQLAEERRQREMARLQDKSDAEFLERKDEALKFKTPEVKVEKVLTPQERIAEAEASLKEIQIRQEIESKKIGFASLKAREAAYNTRNAELESRISQHQSDVEAFEQQRQREHESLEHWLVVACATLPV